MRKTLPCRLDEFQVYTSPVFQPFDEKDDDYGTSNSLPISLRDSFFSHVEVESSDTGIIPAMVTETTNLEEELANIKATLERLSKESKEKDAQIKRQNK